MSDLESRPEESLCESSGKPGPRAEFFPSREVPLGGVRGVTVHRSLPQRDLPTVGAWCFLDYFGSNSPANPQGHDIDPHPHIGLQTVTWPLEGRIRHRDSVGSDVEIRPGQLNLMTSGRGIAHSEYRVPGHPSGRGLQLWIALPDESRGIAPHFEQHRELPGFELPGVAGTVLIGSLGGATSPATAYTPIVGADLRVDAGTDARLPLDPAFEHAVLVVDGALSVDGTPVEPGSLFYLGSDRNGIRVHDTAGAQLLLIGGEPLGEDLVMWWNFVGRSHEEIEAARNDWEKHDLERFPDIAGHAPQQRIPAPPLPGLHLKPRKRRY
ncbi:pirin family protein [Nocardia otitidiscaviarum]|uniref:pirin family protein n=1 Tax=Nocardia otitidiscaviarum TaxID=1823 RepID=UPI0004A7015E|nr:pirin family protein [Nocardia otitidiscaviarum]MBF6137894.1 pirin family protein [Nocardia otitidiscaviarum]MBF6488790.1 pirin family protein [Nocardia otitidiscaviarum]